MVVVVESGGVRKWAGSGALKQAFVEGSLRAEDSGTPVEIDPTLTSLVLSKDVEG